MSDLPRLAVFENLEIFRFQVRNLVTLRIGDHRIHLHEINGNADHAPTRQPASLL